MVQLSTGPARALDSSLPAGNLAAMEMRATVETLTASNASASRSSLAAAALAHDMGVAVLSTTRHADRLPALSAVGVAHPLVDDGAVAELHRHAPERVDSPNWTPGRRHPVTAVYRVDDVQQAHDDLEHNRVVGRW